jgi:cell cycle sensor histidine kinase DivJ
MQTLATYKTKLVEIAENFFHPCVKKNDYVLKRHQSFVYSHLIGAIVALALFPIYLYRLETLSSQDVGILLLFISPLFTVAYLRYSGNLSVAHLISALNLALFVTVGAALTGGLSSFLLAWMVIVPVEAALSGRREVIVAAMLVATASLGGLYLAEAYGWLMAARSFTLSTEALALFGIFTATSYGGAIAMSVQQLHEDSEKFVRESERKYRLMADHATDMISVLDQRGQAVFASPAAATLTGLAPEKLLESGVLKLIHISDRPLYMTAISNCLNGQGPVNVEFRAKFTDIKDCGTEAPLQSGTSTYRWLEMRCKAVPNALKDGELQIVAVTRDISSHKDQEITLLQARDQAESANIAKTRFLANMSHELRTPLNAIIGFSDVLNMELYGRMENRKYADYARLINEAGEHLLSVVNNILDMSKIEVGKFTITPEPFNLPPLLTSCCEMIGPVAGEKNVVVEQNFETDLDYLYADSRALKQMVLNLLSNAIKFSHPGGKVLVHTTLSEDTVHIDVIDYGIGISSEDLPKLCNPFVQADSSYKREHEGVGLGLSVVKGLAELHGGALTISSELGAGTRVRIDLPLRPPQLTGNDYKENKAINTSEAKGRRSVVLFNNKSKKSAKG